MLNNIGLPGLLLIAVVVLVLFGRGKISSLMGEVGKGITAFKKGVGEATGDESAKSGSAREIAAPPEHVDTTPPGPATDRIHEDDTPDPERRRG